MFRPASVITRVRRLLQVLFGASLLALLGGAVLRLLHGLPAEGVTDLLLAAIAVGAWWLRMSDRQPRAASLVLTLCGLGTIVLADTWGFPLLFTGLIVLVVDWGMWLGVAASVLVTVVLAVLLYHQDGGGSEAIGGVLGQTLANALLFGLVLILAAVLRALDAQHTELLAVNARLTEAMDASRDLVLAQERARAAAELHDGLGHQLTLVSMSLDYAHRMRDRDPDKAWSEVANASVAARQALADMRLWVRALHPARLDQLTEPSAFEAVAEVFRGTGLEVTVDVAAGEQLAGPYGLFAYRLIQEGLTNALRHAHASKVVFSIRHDDTGELHLVVGDNGSGSGEIQPGYGLRGLIERAEELGGTLTLLRPGRLGGLDVSVDLPAVAG